MGTHTSNSICKECNGETFLIENTKTNSRIEFCLNEDCRWTSSSMEGFYTKEEWNLEVKEEFLTEEDDE